jgi:hypothetical protein
MRRNVIGRLRREDEVLSGIGEFVMLDSGVGGCEAEASWFGGEFCVAVDSCRKISSQKKLKLACCVARPIPASLKQSQPGVKRSLTFP